MITLSVLSQASVDFIQSILPQKLSEMSIAKAIANKLQLPSSEVKEPAAHYTTFCLGQARTLLSRVNELKVVDISATLEYIRIFWLCRYNILFPTKVYLIAGCDADEHFFGFAQFLTKEIDETIEANLIETIKVLNGFSQIVQEIQDADI